MMMLWLVTLITVCVAFDREEEEEEEEEEQRTQSKIVVRPCA